MEIIKNKEKKISKVKIGALLVGVGSIIGVVGGMVQGQIDFGVGIQAIAVQAGIILGICGIRDLPILNKK